MTEQTARFLAALTERDKLGLAVSGGGDSMAMLHLALGAGLRPAVVTVDHGLRPEAAAEAAGVATIARAHGLTHDTLHWQGAGTTGNLQAEARKARRRLMADWARAQGLRSLALAHTRDDVAETFLMRLARGAGVDGLAAMQPLWEEAGILWQRPLLHTSRADLRQWLAARGLTWVEDPSNENPRFERVRVRQALTSLDGLGLTSARLAEVAQHLAEARQALDFLAEDWARRCLTETAGTVQIDPALWQAPVETQRRLIQRVILWVAPAAYAPRGASVTLLLQRLSQGQPATLAGCRFVADKGGLRAFRETRAAGPRVPARAIWDGRWRLTGPDLPAGAETGALGAEGLALCPDWRDLHLPRAALLTQPALWLGNRLIAAPLAGIGPASYSAEPLLPLLGHNNATISH